MIARKLAVFVLSVICIFLLVGCAGTTSGGPESDDSGRLASVKVRQQQVRELLGEPDERRNIGELNEEWIYYNVKKSLLDDPQAPIQQRRSRRRDEFSVIRVTFGPIPGWAPGSWWSEFKRYLGVSEKIDKKPNEKEDKEPDEKIDEKP